MGITVNLALPLLSLVLGGYLVARFSRQILEGAHWFTVFVRFFALPALIFQGLAAAPPAQISKWSFALATMLSTYVLFIFMFALSLLLRRAGYVTATLQAATASFGNLTFMGIVIAVATLGREAIVPAVLIYLTDAAMRLLLVPLLAGMGASDAPAEDTAEETDTEDADEDTGLEDQQTGTGDVEAARDNGLWLTARDALFHPFLLAAIAGAIVAYAGVQVPQFVANFLDYLAHAAVPAALFATGVMLASHRVAWTGLELPVIVLLKNLVHPVLALAMLSLLGRFDPIWISVAVMMAAMPTAASIHSFAEQNATYEDGTSSVIIITALISAFTLPALLFLIDRQHLPYDMLSFN